MTAKKGGTGQDIGKKVKGWAIINPKQTNIFHGFMWCYTKKEAEDRMFGWKGFKVIPVEIRDLSAKGE